MICQNNSIISVYLELLFRGQPSEVGHIPHHTEVRPLRVGEADREAKLRHKGDFDGLKENKVKV